MDLPKPSFLEIEKALTIDECIDLMQKETVEFERQLKKRQLEIAMKLKINNTVLIPDETIIEIANAIRLIAKLRVYGMESQYITQKINGNEGLPVGEVLKY